MDPNVLDRTKLIVWDLDGTFWDGTLTEGGASFREDQLERVVRASRLGIVCSIASNNDRAPVRRFLQSHRAWKYFVFPQVHWGDKPTMVREIVAAAQLRPHNVLFLDDLPRIRDAVRTATPDLLATATAEEFAHAFDAWSKGKRSTDAKLERLKHYKLLERKRRAERAHAAEGHGTAHDFLRGSAIRCSVLPIDRAMEPRIVELVARTNQLNFTKQPLEAGDLRALLANPGIECRALRVRDRFGDYGICGFYALDVPRNRLAHFLFSCRILNMGVEQAVYERLGRPAIDAEVSRLEPAGDWVRFEEAETPVEPARTRDGGARVALVGPCEMQAIAEVLRPSLGDAIEIDCERTFAMGRGRNVVHFGHHAFLDLALQPEVLARHRATLDSLPWFDPALVDASFLAREEPQVVVLSSVRSAQSADYVHESGEFAVPLEWFRVGGCDLTDLEHWARLAMLLRVQRAEVPEGFELWFAERFALRGPVREAPYRATLERLVAKLPPATRLVVMNVADVEQAEIPGGDRALVRAFRAQHRRINRAIAQTVARHPDRIAVLDVNRHLRGPDDFVRDGSSAGEWAVRAFDPFYHFQRRVTVGLAEDLAQILARWGMLER